MFETVGLELGGFSGVMLLSHPFLFAVVWL
jgi:hypothetical protein